MQGNIAWGALVLLLLAVLLLMLWLSAHPSYWRRRDSADDAAIHTIAEDDEQQIQSAAHAAQRKGLDKGKIEALPIFIYEINGDQKASMENMQGSTASEKGGVYSSSASIGKLHIECPVCLSEFQDKERGRELPNCKHHFHVECIDTWLLTNGTCPVCRASCGGGGGGGEGEVVVQVMGDQRSVISGIQYPTNVLFWGSNTNINARVHSLDGPQQERTAASSMVQIHTAGGELPLDAGPSPSTMASLNPLRRLLSRERRPPATRERRPTAPAAPTGPLGYPSIVTHSHIVFQPHPPHIKS